MTKSELAQSFPRQPLQQIEINLMHNVRDALRKKYRNHFSAIKQIHRDTGIDPRAIKNWYEGKNLPSASHLILLAKIYPTIFCEILKLTGYESLIVQAQEKHVPLNVPNAQDPLYLNNRQMGLLFRLSTQQKLDLKGLALLWNIHEKTIKRDLSILKSRGYIIYIGSKKSGHYKIRTHETDKIYGYPDYLLKPPTTRLGIAKPKRSTSLNGN